MTRKILMGCGLLALLAWTGLGAFAWWSVQKKLHITVAEAADQAGVDEIALLRDAVGTIGKDLAALRGDLDKSLAEVANGLDEAAEERSAASTAGATARIATLEKRIGAALTALEGRTRTALDEVRALRAADITAANVAKSDPKVAPAVIAVPEPSSPVAVAVEAEKPSDEVASPEPAPTLTPTTAPTAAPPTKKKRFLSFSVKSAGIDFDKMTSFTVIPSLSRVGFDAKSTLHDFTGVTSKVEGTLQLRLGDPGSEATGSITVDAASLDSGLAGRDEAMREHLDTAKHTSIRFDLTSITKAQSDAAAKRTSGTATGTMTIRGKARPFEMPVTIQVDEAQRLVVTGQAELALPDYEVPVPNKLGLISMDKTVKVWISLRMRAQQD